MAQRYSLVLVTVFCALAVVFAGTGYGAFEMCVLPAYPLHGTYSVLNHAHAAPGQAFATATLVVSCDPGFEVMGSSSSYCAYGAWSSDKMPECSQCGIVASSGLRLRRSANGSDTSRGEIPWHAGIYGKKYTPYRQICGGSLVSTTLVISAAHCFWDDVVRAPTLEDYAVALGKIYRPWGSRMDFDAQKSDIKSIRLPIRYMGAETNFQDDISLVFLSTPAVYTFHVRPVCLDFSPQFDKSQLDTSVGKVAGWGLTSEDGDPSPVLKTKELLHVDLMRCLVDVPRSFIPFVTSDKICATPVKGTITCAGDSGGGLAFPIVDSQGTQRYYLRGVASTAPHNGHKCNVKSHVLFTHILKHEHFIKSQLNNGTCKLTPHPSVTYACKLTGAGVLSGTRSCREYEPDGTIVVPTCNSPNYYYDGYLPNMICKEGSWDHVAICKPECGTTTPKSVHLVLDGTPAVHGELPWHAGIYDKGFSPYKQICGGSLVSRTIVVSAAHCFWKDGVKRPASRYAVALAKINRPWNDPNDVDVHKSDVLEIKIPPRYMGDYGHLQEDIALVVMATPAVFTVFIRPVCLDFDLKFDRNQLKDTNKGKVAGWGINAVEGHLSPVLLTADLPYVEAAKCVEELPFNFRPYVTSDKICAGEINGTALCEGDSGGGLAFPSVDIKGIRRYYLRGVGSAGPSSEHECTPSYTTFTHVLKHEGFFSDALFSDVYE